MAVPDSVAYLCCLELLGASKSVDWISDDEASGSCVRRPAVGLADLIRPPVQDK